MEQVEAILVVAAVTGVEERHAVAGRREDRVVTWLVLPRRRR